MESGGSSKIFALFGTDTCTYSHTQVMRGGWSGSRGEYTIAHTSCGPDGKLVSPTIEGVPFSGLQNELRSWLSSGGQEHFILKEPRLDWDCGTKSCTLHKLFPGGAILPPIACYPDSQNILSSVVVDVCKCGELQVNALVALRMSVEIDLPLQANCRQHNTWLKASNSLWDASQHACCTRTGACQAKWGTGAG